VRRIKEVLREVSPRWKKGRCVDVGWRTEGKSYELPLEARRKKLTGLGVGHKKGGRKALEESA